MVEVQTEREKRSVAISGNLAPAVQPPVDEVPAASSRVPISGRETFAERAGAVRKLQEVGTCQSHPGSAQALLEV